MSKRLILFTGQKGGTGKSTAARALLDRLRRDQIQTAAYDGDGSNVGQLFQFCCQRQDGEPLQSQSPLTGVIPYDIRDERQRDLLLNSLSTGADVVLHDLPGGSLEALRQLAGAPEALTAIAAECGYRLTLVIVLSPAFASALITRDIVESFGRSADYVAIRNLAFGIEADFQIFDGYTDATGHQVGGKGKMMLEAAGGKVISMPSLSAGGTYWKMDMYDMPFAQASTDMRLSIADRSRVSSFIRGFDRELDKAGRLLGLPL